MTKNAKILLGVGGVGVLVLALAYIFGIDRRTVLPLQPSDTQPAVVLRNRTLTVRTPTGTETLFVPDRAEIKVRTSGRVEVEVRDSGLTFQPGIGAAYDGQILLAADAKVAYWRQWGAVVGLAGTGHRFMGYGGASWTFSYERLNNTSLFVAYSTRSTVLGGVRIGF